MDMFRTSHFFIYREVVFSFEVVLVYIRDIKYVLCRVFCPLFSVHYQRF